MLGNASFGVRGAQVADKTASSDTVQSCRFYRRRSISSALSINTDACADLARRRSDRYGLWAVMPWHQPETLRNALDESMQFAYCRANIKSIVDDLGWSNET